MRSVPRGWGFRSGVGCEHEDGTHEDWTNISPNGRQYRSPITGQVNDLQGADYWEMRKQLPNKLSSASIISADDYSTPSYYHKAKPKHGVLEHKHSDDTTPDEADDGNKEQESVFMSLTEDNVFRKLYMKLTGKEKQK